MFLPIPDIDRLYAQQYPESKAAARYATLSSTDTDVAYSFIATADETMGTVGGNGIAFSDDLKRITQVTDDNREKAFLYQRLSLVSANSVLQRGRHSWQIYPHNPAIIDIKYQESNVVQAIVVIPSLDVRAKTPCKNSIESPSLAVLKII